MVSTIPPVRGHEVWRLPASTTALQGHQQLDFLNKLPLAQTKGDLPIQLPSVGHLTSPAATSKPSVDPDGPLPARRAQIQRPGGAETHQLDDPCFGEGTLVRNPKRQSERRGACPQPLWSGTQWGDEGRASSPIFSAREWISWSATRVATTPVTASWSTAKPSPSSWCPAASPTTTVTPIVASTASWWLAGASGGAGQPGGQGR